MTSIIASTTALEQSGLPDQTLLKHLRHATLPHHRRIEQNARLARLLAPDLSMGEYKEVLARMLGFLQPLEDCIETLPEVAIIQTGLGERNKSPWLVRDLLRLGNSPEEIASIPRASSSDLPAVETLANAVGVLYVLEGSTLGGQLISRHLTQSLGIGPKQGGGFYAGYGPENGRMWSQFRHWLASLELEDHQVDQATAAAIQTFERLDSWILREAFCHG